MGDQGKWVKLWVSWTSDPVMRNLSRSDRLAVLELMSYAKTHGVEGAFEIEQPGVAICQLVQVEHWSELQALLGRLPRRGDYEIAVDSESAPAGLFPVEVVTVRFVHWRRFQDDLSTPRVQAFRDRKRMETVAAVSGETLGNDVETLERRGEENRRDETRGDEAAANHRIKFDRGKQAWMGITLDDYGRWRETYPRVDVEYQLRRMRNWCVENPKKAAKKKSWASFIRNWLTDEEGKARQQGVAPGSRSTADQWRDVPEGEVRL